MVFNKNWKNLDDTNNNIYDFNNINIFKSLSDLFDKLSKFSPKKFTIDELLNKTEEYVDNRVKDICVKNKYVCFGGKLYFNSNIIDLKDEMEFNDTDILNLRVELFFKNISGKWVKSELSGIIPINRLELEDIDTKEFLLNGITNDFSEITYNPPE